MNVFVAVEVALWTAAGALACSAVAAVATVVRLRWAARDRRRAEEEKRRPKLPTYTPSEARNVVRDEWDYPRRPASLPSQLPVGRIPRRLEGVPSPVLVCLSLAIALAIISVIMLLIR